MTHPLPTYTDILDWLVVKGFVDVSSAGEIGIIPHTAIIGFLHALKQKPLPSSLFLASARHAPSAVDSKVIVRRFREGASGLSSKADKATGKKREREPKQEVRVMQLSEF